MIIDYKTDPETAGKYEILDAETGKPLPMSPAYKHIFYADDENGILRMHMEDENGQLQLAHVSDPHTPLPSDTAWAEFDATGEFGDNIRDYWREERKAIKIVPKKLLK